VTARGVHERGVLPERELARAVSVVRVGGRVEVAAVPVRRGLAAGPTEVEPGLAVGARSVVAHAAVVVDLAAVERGRTTRSAALVAASPAAVATGHERRTGSAIDLGEGVHVLKLGATKMTRVVATGRAVVVATAVATAAAVATATTSTTGTAAAAAAAAVAERSVLTLELGLDALAVRRVADRREDGTDALDKLGRLALDLLTASPTHNHTLVDLAVVEDRLDDIVAVAVAQELLQAGAVKHLANEHLADFRVGDADTLFYNIGREPAVSTNYLRFIDSLLHRQAADVADKSADKGFREAGVVEVEYVLNNIVTEGVLDEIQRVEDDLGDKLEALSRGRVVDRALEDAATVAVGGNLDEVGGNRIVDELVVLGDELVETLLNDVVAVEVLDKGDNID
jgi:hypothetical protein